jgi:HSP20 family protein
MNIRDLITRGRSGSQPPGTYRGSDQNPFQALHREMNRLFDDAMSGFGVPTSGGVPTAWPQWPSLEVTETDGEIRVAAEIPGMDQKDIEVLLQNGALILRGEKKSETEDSERQFSERFYGRFERRVPISVEVEEDKVSANFNNGLLTVTLPKSEQAQAKAKRIAINGGS